MLDSKHYFLIGALVLLIGICIGLFLNIINMGFRKDKLVECVARDNDAGWCWDVIILDLDNRK